MRHNPIYPSEKNLKKVFARFMWPLIFAIPKQGSGKVRWLI